jgi:imidazolonepropionase
VTGSLLITRIGELVTNAPPDAGPTAGPGAFAVLNDAALVIEGDRVAWTGLSARAPAADAVVDAAGRAVLPGFVDSHAHLVFAGERSAEFAARMAGLPYEAGGIRSTVLATRAATDAQLRAGLRRLAGEMLRQGTTTFECKSGYGLTVADEARSVALAAEVTAEVTFLGAHVVPPTVRPTCATRRTSCGGTDAPPDCSSSAGRTYSASAARSARTRRAPC